MAELLEEHDRVLTIDELKELSSTYAKRVYFKDEDEEKEQISTPEIKKNILVM